MVSGGISLHKNNQRGCFVKTVFILTRLNIILNSIMTVIVVILVCALTITVGLQVFFRYVIQSSLIWSEEISRYFLIWVSFLGASIALRKRSHINVSMLLDFLTKRGFGMAVILSYAISFVTFLVLSYFGSIIALRNMHQLSVVTRVPMGIVYLCIPISSLLMLVQIIENAWKLFNKDG